MGNNSHYWTNREELKAKAQEHTREMGEKYPKEIEDSIRYTTMYDDHEIGLWNDVPFINRKTGSPIAKVEKNTTDGALFNLPEDAGHIMLLNFASYTSPGGKFIEGSSAQEESLCHASFLYNVLSEFPKFYEWNSEHKNKGMYMNRALVSPHVIFIDKDGDERVAEVLTCAAPNRSLLEQYNAFTEEENLAALKERVEFVKNIAIVREIDTIILGAWGCGVFRQNPDTVAGLFMEAFKGTGIKTVYAIPDDKTLEVFEDIASLEFDFGFEH